MSSALAKASAQALLWSYAGLAIQLLGQAAGIFVLGRLLSPEVFGQFAIVTICYTAAELLVSTGLGPAVIQKNSDDPRYLQTAWTVRFGLSLVLGGLLFLTAPLWTETIFHEPAATRPLQIVAAAIVIFGLSNPQLITLQRNLNLKALTAIDCLSTIARYATAISLGIHYGNVYALALGYAAFLVTQTIASYCFLPALPTFHFSLTILKELFRFSMWLQLQNILNWASRSIAPSLISKQLGVSALGYFNRAQIIASLPEQQLKAIINKIAFPAFCKVQDDPELLGRGHAKLVDLLLLSFAPLIIVFSLNSSAIIRLILGPGWEVSATIITPLIIAILLRSINFSAIPLIRATGGSRPEFLLNLTRIIATATLLIVLIPKYQLTGVVLSLTISELILIPISLIKANKHFSLKLFIVFKSTIITAIAAATSYLTSPLLVDRPESNFELIANCLVQTAIFLLSLISVTYITKEGPWVTFTKTISTFKKRKNNS